jgi:hypothetical protein
MDSISAIPQQPQLGRLAQFLRYLEMQNAPEFLPKQLDVMGLMRQLALPSSQTVENLSYGNSPFTMPPQGTGAMIPQVKTGRKPEVADLIGMISGVPGGKAVIDSGTKISQDALNAYMKMIRETPPIGAVNPSAAMPQIPQPQKSDLGFYSQLEAATIPLQNKGTGTQFLAQIEKTPGVKPEEIKFTGLDEFLRNRETVTKPEIQQFLDQNRVNLQEVRLGEMSPEQLALRNNAINRYREITDSIADTKLKAEQGLLSTEEAMGILRPLVAERGNIDRTINSANTSINTKFSSYTLPGGKNYREILLTLPSKQSVPMRERFSLYNESGELVSQGMWPPSQRTQEKIAANPNLRVERTMVPDKTQRPEGVFVSSHFDQPNILAHMRVNDRVVDGKKTLFIEEIQSDWHQAGRKKGYKGNLEEQNKEIAELKAKFGDLQGGAFSEFNPDKNTFDVFDSFANYKGTFNTQQEAASFVNDANAARNRLVELERNQQSAVPDAPFKTSWHELSLKRAIQEASEKGYDKIAFTTGQTQAARYDLSKQVDSIEWNPYQERGAEKLVTIYPKGGNAIELPITKDGLVSSSAGTQFDGKPLDEVIGKDIAKQITEQRSGDLSGQGLAIGGEGMKGFYDNILPKSLEKLGKKFDAKVGKTTMDGVEVWSMDITPKMRESVLTKGQPLFQVAPAIPAGGLLGQDEE